MTPVGDDSYEDVRASSAGARSSLNPHQPPWQCGGQALELPAVPLA
jgi:hypothetical protein